MAVTVKKGVAKQAKKMPTKKAKAPAKKAAKEAAEAVTATLSNVANSKSSDNGFFSAIASSLSLKGAFSKEFMVAVFYDILYYFIIAVAVAYYLKLSISKLRSFSEAKLLLASIQAQQHISHETIKRVNEISADYHSFLVLSAFLALFLFLSYSFFKLIVWKKLIVSITREEKVMLKRKQASEATLKPAKGIASFAALNLLFIAAFFLLVFFFNIILRDIVFLWISILLFIFLFYAPLLLHPVFFLSGFKLFGNQGTIKDFFRTAFGKAHYFIPLFLFLLFCFAFGFYMTVFMVGFSPYSLMSFALVAFVLYSIFLFNYGKICFLRLILRLI